MKIGNLWVLFSCTWLVPSTAPGSPEALGKHLMKGGKETRKQRDHDKESYVPLGQNPCIKL